MWIDGLLCVGLGYALGNIQPAFAFARSRGYDARVDGSGNVGASNAFILAGKLAFFVTALLDIGKAFLACRLCRLLFPELGVAEQLGGVACILGHMFPVLLRFRGGKGLACLGGVALSWSWRIFLILLALALAIALATRYVSFVAPIMSLLLPGLHYYWMRSLPALLVLLVPALPVIAKHLENFRRIRAGTEARMSFLWDRQGELRRLGRAEDGSPLAPEDRSDT